MPCVVFSIPPAVIDSMPLPMPLLGAIGVPWFAILLVVAFYALVAMEFFLPTGGTAGVAAVVCVIAALIISLEYGVYWALAILLVTTLTTPPLIASLISLWPRTAIGRRILNKRADDPPVPLPVATTRRGTPLDKLIGHRGVAVSDLLPSGLVKIDGERINAVSVGIPINQNEAIIVVGLENRHLQVRPITETHETLDPVANENPIPQSPPSLELDLDDLSENL